MVPPLVPHQDTPWATLPPGIHPASLTEVSASFGTNVWRRELFGGLLSGLTALRNAGCLIAYLDGSYVTGKPRPGDFDACWDPQGVDGAKLNPVFLQFENGRAAQKATFRGEFFPSSMICADIGSTFLDFFQIDRFTGRRKGIVSISLATDPLISGKVQS